MGKKITVQTVWIHALLKKKDKLEIYIHRKPINTDTAIHNTTR